MAAAAAAAAAAAVGVGKAIGSFFFSLGVMDGVFGTEGFGACCGVAAAGVLVIGGGATGEGLRAAVIMASVRCRIGAAELSSFDAA